MKKFAVLIFLPIFVFAIENEIKCSDLDGNLGLTQDGKLYAGARGQKRMLTAVSNTKDETVYKGDFPLCDYKYTVNKKDGKPSILKMESKNCVLGIKNWREETYELGHSNDNCFVSKVKNDLDKKVIYEIDLCSNLSKLFEQYSEADINRCSQIMSKMSATIKDYKAKLKPSGYDLEAFGGGNPYQQAFLQTAECRRRMGNADSKPTENLNIKVTPANGFQ